MRLLRLAALALALPLLLLSGILLFASSPGTVKAVSGNEWRAGRIIDDSVFTYRHAMSVDQIQAFLNSKVPNCEVNHAESSNWRDMGGPYVCLKDYKEDPNIPIRNCTQQEVAEHFGFGPENSNYETALNYCWWKDGRANLKGQAVGPNAQTSAQIIWQAAQDYSINPKVLIVTLQKEQSLVTDSWPWVGQFQKAMGYACPDTAACDPAKRGFYNQVRNAASQLRRYIDYPQNYNFAVGNRFIQYNPNSGCGGTTVNIETRGTAALYNYTPYQPNQAALNNLYGTGDGCSAYGNRNFWRMFTDWFGSTQTNIPYAWGYESQGAFSDAARTKPFTSVPTVVPGGKIYVRVRARNMGNQTWDRSFLRLGTSRPMDRASSFYDASNWLSPERPAQMLESSVAPGGIATFEFAMQAPAATGTYNEYFNLLAEGRTWLNDPGLYFSVNVNNAAGPSNSSTPGLPSGATLQKNQYVMSPDSQSVLTLQSDGNLALYSNFQIVWSRGVLGSSNRLIMQPDGNLVLYDTNNKPLWNTETQGNPGAWLALQTDGNLVVYSASNTPLWAAYTLHNPDHLAYINTTFPTGRLYPGQFIQTADRRFRLIMQGDGNLVLYSPNRPTWATGTDGKSVLFLAMQGDGNLVLYDTAARPIWNSQTAGYPGLRLVVQQDGNLVLYDRFNTPRWHTFTHGAM